MQLQKYKQYQIVLKHIQEIMYILHIVRPCYGDLITDPTNILSEYLNFTSWMIRNILRPADIWLLSKLLTSDLFISLWTVH